MQKIDTYEIVVIGGGLTGLLVAGALAQVGKEVCVLDHYPFHIERKHFSPDGRNISLTAATKIFFNTLGVWKKIAPYAAPLSEIHVLNQNKGKLVFSKKDNNGYPLAYMVAFDVLHHLLQEWASSFPNILFRSDVKIQDINTNVDFISLVDGDKTIRSPLLIGADGKNSTCRTLMGVPYRKWSYKQGAFVAMYRHEKKHDYKAYENFLASGPFAILPMKEENISSIVWSVKEPLFSHLEMLSDNDFDKHIREHFNVFGKIDRIGPKVAYPLTGHWVPAFVRPRFCLIGDAAHSMHPLAGLGFNIGVSDVAALISILRHAQKNGLDLGSYALLKEFEHAQKPKHRRFILGINALDFLFSCEHPLANSFRDSVLRVGDNLMGLKKSLFSILEET